MLPGRCTQPSYLNSFLSGRVYSVKPTAEERDTMNIVPGRAIVAAVLLAGAFASPLASQDSARVASVRGELEKRYDLNAAAFMRGDVRALMELRSDDFHTIAPNGSPQDRAAMQNYIQGVINGVRKWNQQTIVIDSLHVAGDTAVAFVWQFLDRIALRPDARAHHIQTWATQRETWVYQKGRWLLWRVDQVRNQRRLVDGKPG
jgi:ketosteroid isomerase-like protein